MGTDATGIEIRLLTAEQCDDRAQDMLEALTVCTDPVMREWIRDEAREWQVLAAERARENTDDD